MGSAAYNRGSRAISAEIDRELEAKRPPVSRRAYEQLEGELAIAQTRLARAETVIEHMREAVNGLDLERRTLDEALREATRRVTRLRAFWRAARVRADMMERRWRWVSSIVRCHVSPAMVDEHRVEPVTRDVGKADRRLAG